MNHGLLRIGFHRLFGDVGDLMIEGGIRFLDVFLGSENAFARHVGIVIDLANAAVDGGQIILGRDAGSPMHDKGDARQGGNLLDAFEVQFGFRFVDAVRRSETRGEGIDPGFRNETLGKRGIRVERSRVDGALGEPRFQPRRQRRGRERNP